MRQFPPETNRYITSAREREKKEKKLFSLFLEKHKFFFWSDVLHARLHWEHSSGAYVWTSRLNYSSGGVPWLKEGSSRGCRSFLAAVRTRSGASFSWFFDVIFLAPLPPPSLPPPPASLFRISRRQELWRDKCILAELSPKKKTEGGKPTADEDGEGSRGQRDDERRAGEQRVDDPADALADDGLPNIWTERAHAERNLSRTCRCAWLSEWLSRSWVRYMKLNMFYHRCLFLADTFPCFYPGLT